MRAWPRARPDEGLLDLLEEAGRNAQRTGVLVRDLLVDIFDSLERSIDARETVANVLEGISLRGGLRA